MESDGSVTNEESFIKESVGPLKNEENKTSTIFSPGALEMQRRMTTAYRNFSRSGRKACTRVVNSGRKSIKVTSPVFIKSRNGLVSAPRKVASIVRRKIKRPTVNHQEEKKDIEENEQQSQMGISSCESVDKDCNGVELDENGHDKHNEILPVFETSSNEPVALVEILQPTNDDCSVYSFPSECSSLNQRHTTLWSINEEEEEIDSCTAHSEPELIPALSASIKSRRKSLNDVTLGAVRTVSSGVRKTVHRIKKVSAGVSLLRFLAHLVEPSELILSHGVCRM